MRNRKALIGMIILFLAIGFATVSTTLVINGILSFGENKDDFDIIFTKAKLNGVIKNNFISEDKKHIEFISNELKTLEDKAILTYEVTNTSRNYDADVQVTCTSGTTELITFEYTPHQMEILASETKSGTLTASMFKLVDEPTDVPIECTLTATAKERENLGEEYIAPFSRSGVMMVATNDSSNPEGLWAYRSNVTKVIFEDKLIPHQTTEELTFDVSEAQDKSVMAYLVPNGGMLSDDMTTYNLYIQGNTGVIAKSGTGLFSRFYNLSEIENLKFLDTSIVTSMNGMFSYCSNLSSVDVSTFDTSKVTSMQGMFEDSGLINLDLSNFDTSNVTDMTSMFNEALKLVTVNLSSFNTSKVSSFYFTFRQCRNLIELDLNSFDVSRVTSFLYAFEGCRNLKKVLCSNWNLNNKSGIEMFSMFGACSSLVEIDVSNWDMSKVTRTASMFGECSSLVSLDVSRWNMKSVRDTSSMFNRCTRLVSLDVSNWNVSNVKGMSNMFANCQKLTDLDVSKWNTSNVTNMSTMFDYCYALKTINISNWDTSKVTNMYHMFYDCDNLTNVDVSNWNTSSVKNMSGMFAYCEKLEALDVSNWITDNVTDMSSMFGYLRKVTNLDVSNWNTSNVTTMRAMFVECNVLGSLDLSNFDLTNVTNLNSFVLGCHVLNTTITIRGTNCTEFDGEDGYWAIFFNAATNGNIVVNYTADASDLVDQMIATKSSTSKVYKGVEVA